jgi:hypothetical protein
MYKVEVITEEIETAESVLLEIPAVYDPLKYFVVNAIFYPFYYESPSGPPSNAENAGGLAVTIVAFAIAVTLPSAPIVIVIEFAVLP